MARVITIPVQFFDRMLLLYISAFHNLPSTNVGLVIIADDPNLEAQFFSLPLPVPPGCRLYETARILNSDNDKSFKMEKINDINKIVERAAGLTELEAKRKQHFKRENPMTKEVVMQPSNARNDAECLKWRARAYQNNPDLGEIRSRVSPLHRTVDFTSAFSVGTNAVKKTLTPEVVVQLMMQHFSHEGFRNAFTQLEEESKLKYVFHEVDGSRLAHLVQHAVARTDHIYDLAINDRDYRSDQVADYLISIGMNEVEEIQEEKDINIWDTPLDTREHIVYVGDEILGEGECTPKREPKEVKESTEKVGEVEQTQEGATDKQPSGNSNITVKTTDTIQRLDTMPLSPRRSAGNRPAKSRQNAVEVNVRSLDELRGATLNKLIEKMTWEKVKDNVALLRFTKTFLVTYRSFTTPQKVLLKLVQRYHVPRPKRVSEMEYKKRKLPVQLRVCNVLNVWVKDYFDDFQSNPKLLASLEEFLNDTLTKENQALAKKLRNTLDKQRNEESEKLEKKKKFVFDTPAPASIYPKNLFSPRVTLLDFADVELARQLTILEWEPYKQIHSSELLNQSWLNPRLKYAAPNVLAMLRRREFVQSWVLNHIVGAPTIDRSKTISMFVMIAFRLSELHNYASCFAILNALNYQPVMGHLGKSVQGISPVAAEKWSEMRAFWKDPAEKNFTEYEKRLRLANPPCIPYLEAHLSGIVTVEETTSDRIGRLINMEKRRRVFEIIQTIQQYQTPPYNLNSIYQMQQFIVGKLKYDLVELEVQARKLE
jgi:hypothetical protein